MGRVVAVFLVICLVACFLPRFVLTRPGNEGSIEKSFNSERPKI